MSSSINGIDTASLISSAANKQLKFLGMSGSSFNSLLAQITQIGAANEAAAQTPQPASTPSIHSGSLSEESTPIQRLENYLQQSGQSMDRFEVPSSGREKLVQVLEESGYSEEDAEAIVKRATKDDGSISLAAVFNLLDQYEANQGPFLLIDSSQKNAFIQVLQELGLSQEDIQDLINSSTDEDGMLKIKNFRDLLAKVEEAQAAQGSAGKVNKGILSNLLQQLGLTDEEIQTLLEQGSDSEGNLRAEAALDILKKAAATQDNATRQSLKDLAAMMRVNTETDSEANMTEAEAKRIKNQVNKMIQAMEGGDKDSKTSLKDTLQAALADEFAEEGVELKGSNLNGLEHTATPKVKASAEAASSEDKQQAFQFAKQQQGSQAKPEVTGADSQGGSNNTAKAGSATVGLGSAGRSTEAAQTAGVRGTLPSYVVHQVGERMAQMIKNNQSSLKINIKPPELGELNLELSVKDGVLRATLTAESVAAKNTLDAGSEQLKQLLSQQGLKVESLDIILKSDSQNAGAGFQDQLDKKEHFASAKGQSGQDLTDEMDESELAAVIRKQALAGGGSINVFA